MKKILALITLPLLLAACSKNSSEQSTITAEDLQHHNWTLVKINDEPFVAAGNMHAPNLEIGQDLMANGNAGCNNFFGQSELKDNQFRIEKMGMTMKMCIGDAMKTERVFAESISDWNDIALTDNQLILKGKTNTLVFELADWKQ